MKKFIQPVNIRFFDIDMNMHVNNSVYFTYMENARTELLLDDFLKCKKEGKTFVISETSCKYKNPMRLDDHVVCEIVFTVKRSVQFNVEYTFKNKDTGLIYAIGDTKVVMINEARNRPIPIPQYLIDNFMN